MMQLNKASEIFRLPYKTYTSKTTLRQNAPFPPREGYDWTGRNCVAVVNKM